MAINPGNVNLSEVREVLISNFSKSDLIKNLPPELISKISGLIILFKTIGIIFLIYIVFLIIKSIFGIRRNIRINKIYNKVNEIDDKLNILLKNKGMRTIKEEVSENKSLKKLKPKK